MDDENLPNNLEKICDAEKKLVRDSKYVFPISTSNENEVKSFFKKKYGKLDGIGKHVFEDFGCWFLEFDKNVKKFLPLMYFKTYTKDQKSVDYKTVPHSILRFFHAKDAKEYVNEIPNAEYPTFDYRLVLRYLDSSNNKNIPEFYQKLYKSKEEAKNRVGNAKRSSTKALVIPVNPSQKQIDAVKFPPVDISLLRNVSNPNWIQYFGDNRQHQINFGRNNLLIQHNKLIHKELKKIFDNVKQKLVQEKTIKRIKNNLSSPKNIEKNNISEESNIVKQPKKKQKIIQVEQKSLSKMDTKPEPPKTILDDKTFIPLINFSFFWKLAHLRDIAQVSIPNFNELFAIEKLYDDPKQLSKNPLKFSDDESKCKQIFQLAVTLFALLFAKKNKPIILEKNFQSNQFGVERSLLKQNDNGSLFYYYNYFKVDCIQLKTKKIVCQSISNHDPYDYNLCSLLFNHLGNRELINPKKIRNIVMNDVAADEFLSSLHYNQMKTLLTLYNHWFPIQYQFEKFIDQTHSFYPFLESVESEYLTNLLKK